MANEETRRAKINQLLEESGWILSNLHGKTPNVKHKDKILYSKKSASDEFKVQDAIYQTVIFDFMYATLNSKKYNRFYITPN